MTAAFPEPEGWARVKANWLGRYLDVEAKGVQEVNVALQDAERRITKELSSLGADNISTGVRRAQLNLSLRSVRGTLKDTFGTVTDIVRDSQQQAALAAVEAGLFDDRNIMAKLFPNKADRENFTESMKETAKRNIQATVTRVLHTEQPLSQRVWKTQALANGWVNRTVNDALARGASADDLAKDVSNLVRPDVPGGVSYASKRLARTEINNAFHAQAIADMQDKPWVTGVQWNLSKRHASDPGDPCEDYAKQIFAKNNVPRKPHPQCRCFVTAIVEDYDQFEPRLIAGDYDAYINKVLKQVPPAVEAPKPKAKGALTLDQCFRVDQVVQYMMQEHPNITFKGFNTNEWAYKAYPEKPIPNDLDGVKQVARALDDMQREFPESKLNRVEIRDDGDPGIIMSTDWVGNRWTQKVNTKIVMQRRHFIDPATFKQHMVIDVANKYHPIGSDKDPFYASFVHEYAHTLDFTGQSETSDNADHYWHNLFRRWDREHPGNLVGFREWLPKNTVLYQRVDSWGEEMPPGQVSLVETVSESFLDYWLNRDKAMYGSKFFYDQVIKDAKRPWFQKIKPRPVYEWWLPE